MLRVALLTGWIFAAAAVASGQAFFPIDQASQAGRFIEPPRAVVQQLRQAEEAAGQRRFGDAVVILGDLLQRQPTGPDDELSGQDFFIESAGEGDVTPRVSKTLIGEARRILSGLPREAIETYELRYGVNARKILDDAVGERRWGDVADVKRWFFHTVAGRDATQLLLHRAIVLGRLSQAQRLSDSLLAHPQLDDASRKAVSEISSVIKSMVTSNVTPSEATPSDAPKLAETLPANHYSVARSKRIDSPTDFLSFSVPSTSRSVGGGQLPLTDPRYKVFATGSPRQERTLNESVEAMKSVGELPPPSWLPLRVGNQILMRNTEGLLGVDFQTGKLIWQYPWFETTERVEPTEVNLGGTPDDESGQALLKQRVWNDLPYGRISSDGKRVYILGDLAAVEIASFSPLMGIQGTRPAEGGSNSLIALELATEGKLAWQIGGDMPDVNPLAGAFFLAPPLPIDDALYVMAEISGDILLVCLDAASGIERWRQQLLAIESGSIESDPVRRVAGAAATYKDGLLICSTGAGAIIAVDLDDRALVWGVAIERNNTLQQNVIGRQEQFAPDLMLKRWWDGTPMIEGSTIFVTPIESDRFFAFDLFTGEKRWKEFARAQTGSRYFAGVHSGTIVLVGSDNVRGVDSTSGKTTWVTRSGWLDSGEQVCGLGMFGVIDNPASGEVEPSYFVPTSSNRIIAVSLKDGSALAHRTTGFELGNLIAVDGQIISHSATWLSVADGEQSLNPIVAAALESDPDDFEMMIRKAQLLIEQGKRKEALEWLDKARPYDPENDSIRTLSISAMLGALREDFKGNGQLLAALDGMIDQPSLRAELLKLQVRAAIELARPVEAAEKLFHLSTLVASDTSFDLQSTAFESESSRSVSLDNWVRARVQQLSALASPEQSKAIAEKLDQHLVQFASAPTPKLQRLVHQFGTTAGSEKTVQELLRRYTEESNWLAIEKLVYASAATTPDRLGALSAWQSVALARAQASGGMRQDAAEVLRIAKEQSEKDVELAASELGIDLNSLVIASAGGSYWKLWDGNVEVQLSDDRVIGGGNSRQVAVAETKRNSGLTFQGWQLVSEESSPVGIRDPLGIVHPIPLDGITRPDETYREAIISGGMMIAMMPGELVGINLYSLLDGQSDPVLWRYPWRSETGGSGFKLRSEASAFGDRSNRYVMSSTGGNAASSELLLGPIVGDTFYVLQGNELIAMDALTRQIRWRNLEAPRGGAIVCDGNRVAIVSPKSQLIVRYDCYDGRKIGEEPLVDYRIWTATDNHVLLYRELGDGKRELVLRDPINNRTILEHVYDGIVDDSKVRGRIVEGHYAVTLETSGKVLIWDIVNGRVVSDLMVEPIAKLRSLHVLPRHDSLVLLPESEKEAATGGTIAMNTVNGLLHVTVDIAAWNIDVATGKLVWTCALNGESWGCTPTQTGFSPLIIFSRGKSRYLTTGSREKSLDLLAIDTRDGKTYPTMDVPVASFTNDIETRLTLLAPQQQVKVNVGATTVTYNFTGREIPKTVGQEPAQEDADPSPEVPQPLEDN